MGFVISILIAVEFFRIIRCKMMYEEEFSGIIWGLVCGVCAGWGPIIIAHYYLGKNLKKLEKLKNAAKNLDSKDNEQDGITQEEENLEPYAQYAKRQLKDFFITYWICTIIWILVESFIYLHS